jgi:hypothetical protein
VNDLDSQKGSDETDHASLPDPINGGSITISSREEEEEEEEEDEAEEVTIDVQDDEDYGTVAQPEEQLAGDMAEVRPPRMPGKWWTSTWQYNSCSIYLSARSLSDTGLCV